MTSFQITKKPHNSVKILIRNNIDFPVLGKDGGGHTICLPEPRKINTSFVGFQGMIFDLNNDLEKRILSTLFKASVYHLSAHVAVSDFSLYRQWARKKDINLATFVVSLLEDAYVNLYLRKDWAAVKPELDLANIATYMRLKPQSLIPSKMPKIMTALLSFYNIGMIKGNIPENMLNDVKDIVATLRETENRISQDAQFNNPTPTSSEEDNTKPQINLWALDKKEKLEAVNKIYERLAKYEETPSIPAWPYTESHGKCPILQNGTINMEKLQKVLKESIKPESQNFYEQLNEILGKDESSQLLFEWQSRENAKNKVLQNYRAFAEDVRFESFEFPQEDYTEYIRARALLGGPIRRVLEKLRLLKNITGEDFRQESGFIDLQEAIQVIASQSQRSDIFVREELQSREDSWVILIDASHSLKFFTGDVLSVAVCLAEVAKNLILNQNAWSMYAFNSKFYIIKEFSEPFTNRIKARIGGMRYGGMTYLPDGIKMASQILLHKRKEESKVLVVVSDFFPSGIENAEEELAAVVRKVERVGVGVIGIGVRSDAVKRYFRTNCTIRDPYELMKKFSKAFIELSGAS